MNDTYFSTRLATAAKSTLYKTVFLFVAMLGLGSASVHAESLCSGKPGAYWELSHSDNGNSLTCRLLGGNTKVFSFDSTPEKRLDIIPVGTFWNFDQTHSVGTCVTVSPIPGSPPTDCRYTVDIHAEKPTMCTSIEKKMYEASTPMEYQQRSAEHTTCLSAISGIIKIPKEDGKDLADKI